MLGQRVRRFRVDQVLARATSSRSLRIPSVSAALTSSISHNHVNVQSYSTFSYVAARAKTNTESAEKSSSSSSPSKSTNKQSNLAPLPPSSDGLELAKFHGEYFTSKSNQSVYDLRTGSYQEVDEQDIAKYFPEGLAGEATSEFQFSRKKRWMVRDSTKVLFRLIEETEKALNYVPYNQPADAAVPVSVAENANGAAAASEGAPKIEGVGIHAAVNIPRLTGQREWDSSELKVSYFGKELYSNAPVPATDFEGFVLTKGPGSPLENAIDALKAAAAADKKPLPDRIMLSGGRGHGKSIVLNQAVLYARQRGWMVLFVPNGWDHVQSGPYVQPLKTKVNGVETMVYDNPFMNKDLLRGFWKAHHKQLAKVQIRDTASVLKYKSLIVGKQRAIKKALESPGRERLGFLEMRALITPPENYLSEYDSLDAELLKNYSLKSELKTLEDLLLLGVAFAEASGLVVHDLVRELREQTDFPVLFAVDQYNTWFAESGFAYGGEGKLNGQRLNVPSQLSFLDRKKNSAASKAFAVKNGLCIATTSFKHVAGKDIHFDREVKNSLPLRVSVNAYSQQEFISAISYYLQPDVSPLGAVLNWEDVFTYRMLTQSVPQYVRSHAIAYFLPKSVRTLEKELEMAALLGMSDPTKTVVSTTFDANLGYDEDDELLDFDTVVAEEGGKIDDRYFANEETDADPEEEFFEAEDRKEEDIFYSDDEGLDAEDDDLPPATRK